MARVEGTSSRLSVTLLVALFSGALPGRLGALQARELLTHLPEVAYGEPDLAIHPGDPSLRLVGVMELEDDAPVRVTALVTRDGGRNWERRPPAEVETIGAFDPWVDIDSAGGLHLSMLVRPGEGAPTPMEVWVFRANSVDDPWEGPERIIVGEGSSWDQPKLTVLRDGTRVVVGDKWPPRTENGSSGGAVGLSVALPGDTFGVVEHLEANNLKKSPGEPVQLEDGSILLGFHEYLPVGMQWGDPGRERLWSGGMVWTIRSQDAGRSWDVRNYVAAGAGPGLFRLAVAPGGTLWGAWATEDGGVVLARSKDEGERWESPLLIKGPSGSLGVALKLAVDGRGRPGVLWGAPALDSPGEGQRCFEGGLIVLVDPSDRSSLREVSRRSWCLTTPGPVVGRFSGYYVPANDRFGRGGEYLGLVGLPGGGFSAVWIEDARGRTRLFSGEWDEILAAR